MGSDLFELRRKLLPREYVEQLGQQHLARAQLELAALGRIEQLPGQSSDRYHARHQQIRIDDDAHRSSAQPRSAITPRGLHLDFDLIFGDRWKV